MKILHSLTLLLLIFLILIFSSCRKGGKCEEAFDISRASEVVVTFKDAVTGKYLYEVISPLYNKDSLKVFDEGANSLIILKKTNTDINTNIQYWNLSFGNIYNSRTDASSFNSEVCRNFIVKYTYNEIDTLKVCFKARKTDCGSVFDPIKVFHKGQLIGTETGQSGLVVTVIKN